MTSTNQPTSATTDPNGNGPDWSGPAADPGGLLRAWTSTGAQLFDRDRATREGHNYATGPDAVTAAIDTLTWQTLPADGTVSAPFRGLLVRCNRLCLVLRWHHQPAVEQR
jgi:hypothetical protein